MEVGAETARRLWERSGVGPAEVDLPQVYDGFSPFVYFWMESLGLCPVGEAHRLVLEGGIDSDRAGRVAGALRRRRARKRADARRAADARVLPATVRSGGRASACRTRPSAWRVIPLRTTAARSSTAPSRSDDRAEDAAHHAGIVTTDPATVLAMTWAERAADRSPVVQRSKEQERRAGHGRSLRRPRRLIETKGPSFTTQELIKEAGIALQTFYRYFPEQGPPPAGRHRGRHRRELQQYSGSRPASCPIPSIGCGSTSRRPSTALEAPRQRSQLHHVGAFPAPDALPGRGLPGHAALHGPPGRGDP